MFHLDHSFQSETSWSSLDCLQFSLYYRKLSFIRAGRQPGHRALHRHEPPPRRHQLRGQLLHLLHAEVKVQGGHQETRALQEATRSVLRAFLVAK